MEIKDILLVEDSLNDIELTLAAFDELNLTNNIVVTRDGAEALDYLYRRGEFTNRSQAHPVMILLDLKMPKVDGLEVLRQIKRDPVLQHIPVVMFTSSREERDIIESYNLGTNSYAVKPVDFDEFAKVIKQLGLFWALINETPHNTTG